VNKKDLTEADIRTKFITPALVGVGRCDVIVAKVDEPIILVNALEAHHSTARSTGSALLEAVLAEQTAA